MAGSWTDAASRVACLSRSCRRQLDRFIISWYPGSNLNQLVAQRASAEPHPQAEVGQIASRASYLASFALHDEFEVEWREDGGVVPLDSFGLLLDHPEGSFDESGPYVDDEAGLEDTGTTEHPDVTAEEPPIAQPGTGVA